MMMLVDGDDDDDDDGDKKTETFDALLYQHNNQYQQYHSNKTKVKTQSVRNTCEECCAIQVK